MRTRVLAAGVVAVLAGTHGVGDARSSEQAAPAKSETQPLVLNLEFLAGRPLVRVSVNGKGPFAFLLSPQAETTLIDRRLASELNLNPQGSASGGTQIEVTFEFGATKTPVSAEVTDIAQLAPGIGPAALPRGLISLSMWTGQLVTIDYPRWRVSIQPGVLPDADGREVFELNAARELTVPLSMAERSVPCSVDPLFQGGIVVPASFVKDLVVAGRSIPRGPVKTPQGVLDMQEARLAVSVRLGSFEIPNPVLQFSERLSPAIVGGQALGEFSITYDWTNRRARLERQKQPSGRD